ncbi:MAG: MBL fold metallo-hydrolase [Caldilineaceae bacterium]
MQKVIDGIYWIEGLSMGRVYLLEGSDGLTLIDASVAGSWPKIIKDLAKAGKSSTAIKRILITHAHPDHIGGLAEIQAATRAAVYVHRKDAAVTRGDERMPRPAPGALQGSARVLASIMPAPTLKPSPVARELEDGDPLDEVMPGMQVIATPGHSPGHSSFWLPKQQLLFTGDVVMRLPKLRLPFAAFTPDMAESKRSLQRIAKMEIETLCFGHGDPIIGKAMIPLREFVAKV